MIVAGAVAAPAAEGALHVGLRVPRHGEDRHVGEGGHALEAVPEAVGGLVESAETHPYPFSRAEQRGVVEARFPHPHDIPLPHLHPDTAPVESVVVKIPHEGAQVEAVDPFRLHEELVAAAFSRGVAERGHEVESAVAAGSRNELQAVERDRGGDGGRSGGGAAPVLYRERVAAPGLAPDFRSGVDVGRERMGVRHPGEHHGLFAVGDAHLRPPDEVLRLFVDAEVLRAGGNGCGDRHSGEASVLDTAFHHQLGRAFGLPASAASGEEQNEDDYGRQAFHVR